MNVSKYYAIGGLNLYVNPLAQEDGHIIRAVNVYSDYYGAKSKRPGYDTYLGTADGSAVHQLWSWYKNDGVTFYNYRASGSKVYYSSQGTGAWTVCGNGTIGAGNYVGNAVLDDTMIICDGEGSTRHTTNGTSFTDTTLAPVAVDLEMYQNRIYAAGTSSTLFYSTTGTASNWDTAVDSSSLTVPGAGKLLKVIKVADKMVATKNSGIMQRWDGYSLVDMSTKLGPTSPHSVDEVEGYYFWLNRLGIFGYGGVNPQLVSNAITSLIYNNSGSAIAGSDFDSAPGAVHKYDYYLSAGTVTDDLTRKTIDNALIKYDYNKNEFTMYSTNDYVTSMHSYKDADGNEQLLLGSTGGQVYELDTTSYSDNGNPIEAILEFVVHKGVPELDKKWNWYFLAFNPGCSVKVMVAFSNSYDRDRLKWQSLGTFTEGIAEGRFPEGSRSKLLFIRVTEKSSDKPFTFYGMSIDAEMYAYY